jgi:hypothetical protein
MMVKQWLTADGYARATRLAGLAFMCGQLSKEVQKIAVRAKK